MYPTEGSPVCASSNDWSFWQGCFNDYSRTRRTLGADAGGVGACFEPQRHSPRPCHHRCYQIGRAMTWDKLPFCKSFLSAGSNIRCAASRSAVPLPFHPVPFTSPPLWRSVQCGGGTEGGTTTDHTAILSTPQYFATISSRFYCWAY